MCSMMARFGSTITPFIVLLVCIIIASKTHDYSFSVKTAQLHYLSSLSSKRPLKKKHSQTNLLAYLKSPLFSFALVIVIIYCKTSLFLFGSIIVYTLTKITKPALASMDINYRFLILDLRATFVRISANITFLIVRPSSIRPKLQISLWPRGFHEEIQ